MVATYNGQQSLPLVDLDPCKCGHLMAHGPNLVVLDQLKFGLLVLVAVAVVTVNQAVLVVLHKELSMLLTSVM
tara:strand:+ start:139 stop:357 length:219 start_codon:yes stop_codon:yes gene_type:complete